MTVEKNSSEGSALRSADELDVQLENQSAHQQADGEVGTGEIKVSEHAHGFAWREASRIAFIGIAAAVFWFLGGPLLRPEAKQAIQDLKAMQLKTVLLTTDAKTVAEDVGAKLGVDAIESELLPEEKLRYVQRLAKASRVVAMVGDGVNDAPALALASVGIAMGSGTDVARESADVVLIGDDLSKLVQALRIARRCRRTILQNFVGTLVVDSIGIGLAAFGYLNPLLAAFIQVSSELLFILNSARLVPSGSLMNTFRGQADLEGALPMSQRTA